MYTAVHHRVRMRMLYTAGTGSGCVHKRTSATHGAFESWACAQLSTTAVSTGAVAHHGWRPQPVLRGYCAAPGRRCD